MNTQGKCKGKKMLICLLTGVLLSSAPMETLASKTGSELKKTGEKIDWNNSRAIFRENWRI